MYLLALVILAVSCFVTAFPSQVTNNKTNATVAANATKDSPHLKVKLNSTNIAGNLTKLSVRSDAIPIPNLLGVSEGGQSGSVPDKEGKNETKGWFKKALGVGKEIAFQSIFGGKLFYELLPAQTKSKLEGYLTNYTDEGFSKINEKIDETESSLVAQSIDFIRNIIIPLIKLMSDVKNQSAFDCW